VRIFLRSLDSFISRSERANTAPAPERVGRAWDALLHEVEAALGATMAHDVECRLHNTGETVMFGALSLQV